LVVRRKRGFGGGATWKGGAGGPERTRFGRRASGRGDVAWQCQKKKTHEGQGEKKSGDKRFIPAMRGGKIETYSILKREVIKRGGLKKVKRLGRYRGARIRSYRKAIGKLTPRR